MSREIRAEEIASALGGKKKTPTGYLCRCPCHEDKQSSLSIKINEKGLILHCFAGCDWQDIKRELERMGLLEQRKSGAGSSAGAGKATPPARRNNKYDGAKFYIYKDLAGNQICRKVKLPDKKMWFERWDSGEWQSGLAGMTIPLYNLQAVTAADVVYLCEGEKDAETMIAAGLCGTTNHAGALGWAEHLTQQLKNKTVIIIPDNDDAGRKRLQKLSRALHEHVKELRAFLPPGVPDHGDITDWKEAGGDVTKVFELSTVIEKRKKIDKAPREDYFRLFDKVWNNPRKCIFDNKLMFWDESEQLWNPCINELEIAKSEAIVENEERGKTEQFCVSRVEYHFRVYEREKEPELLVDIPDWDGQDRISAMAYLMKLNPAAGVTEEALSELLKEWCALMFERLYDPYVQNRILILQGPQGIGKDTWQEMLLDGLGQYCIPLSVVGNDKDTFLSLHDGLVMKISEFDKTSKTEVSTLKDMITTPKTKLRAAFGRDRKSRVSRCSFISSANVKDILRDSTGNRRYLIFEVQEIEYAYEGWTKEQKRHWQMQCLAEMRELAKTKYRASGDSQRQMREYIEGHTPSDIGEDVVEIFIRRYRESSEFLGHGEIEVSPNETRALEIISGIAKDLGVKPRTVRALIGNALAVRLRVGNTRARMWRLPPLPMEQ